MTFGPVTVLPGLDLAAMHGFVNQERCAHMVRAASFIIVPRLDTTHICISTGTKEKEQVVT